MIVAQDPAKTHWKQSGQTLRDLLEEWKTLQRRGPRLEKAVEDELWKRFSSARTQFDRHRRQFFSQLDQAQSEAKRIKEALIAEAEALSSSVDWSRTSSAYRELMNRVEGSPARLPQGRRRPVGPLPRRSAGVLRRPPR